MLPKDVIESIALYALGTQVPTRNMTRRIEHEDRAPTIDTWSVSFHSSRS
jgi:hypothetical protein